MRATDARSDWPLDVVGIIASLSLVADSLVAVDAGVGVVSVGLGVVSFFPKININVEVFFRVAVYPWVLL